MIVVIIIVTEMMTITIRHSHGDTGESGADEGTFDTISVLKTEGFSVARGDICRFHTMLVLSCHKVTNINNKNRMPFYQNIPGKKNAQLQ